MNHGGVKLFMMESDDSAVIVNFDRVFIFLIKEIHVTAQDYRVD